jgi:hypothetical protein
VRDCSRGYSAVHALGKSSMNERNSAAALRLSREIAIQLSSPQRRSTGSRHGAAHSVAALAIILVALS